MYGPVWVRKASTFSRKKVFKAYQVNRELVSHARSDAIVMHCLPAHRGEEISEEMMDNPLPVIWDQSENKMHINKAILEAVMIKNR